MMAKPERRRHGGHVGCAVPGQARAHSAIDEQLAADGVHDKSNMMPMGVRHKASVKFSAHGHVASPDVIRIIFPIAGAQMPTMEEHKIAAAGVIKNFLNYSDRSGDRPMICLNPGSKR